MPHQPSIQSFYERPIPSSQKTSSTNGYHAGDGFNSDELISASLPSALPAWVPKGEYAHTEIDTVTAGPGSVKIVGRIIHLEKRPWTATQNPGLGASGYIKMVLRDDSGIITVPLPKAKSPSC